ncbi:hypothetical protein D477_006206 [Arthrobacter crystallopoietes BAB-32]|uniref:Flavin-nucleotide-binding protein n=1 Tax=Arthrobacter crystallopoietes BAB-32 TaxID=1246476 RepID=N1V4X5_9MICC|nr:pyridoxamine 5'-phosphate oxidase family protein [Arthrobacter crystallopoietes]EMY35074.1 hypothetical protein D477_006206 [Arthrobacter crystallopoietes BAB-32]
MPNQGATPQTEILDELECWRLLRGVSLGRLAVWVEDHPDIFPVNYTVDRDTLVFRTGSGTKLAAVAGDTPLALEADGVNAASGIAWSVVLKGQAAEVEPTGEFLDSVARVLFPWQPGRKDHFVRIVPTTITGRRFAVEHPKAWWISLDEATRAGLE